MIGSRTQSPRITNQDEAWAFTVIGHPGTRVLEKIGMGGGFPSVHASFKSLAASKSS